MRLDEQLLVLLDRLRDRAACIFGGVTLDDADQILRIQLTCLGDERAEFMARKIGLHLIDRAELDSEAFWATPLGRQLAWHVGYPYEQCPAALVHAILGTSRQYAHRVCAEMVTSRDALGRRHVPASEVRRLVHGREQNRPAL